jgi:hypothetical protein
MFAITSLKQYSRLVLGRRVLQPRYFADVSFGQKHLQMPAINVMLCAR